MQNTYRLSQKAKQLEDDSIARVVLGLSQEGVNNIFFTPPPLKIYNISLIVTQLSSEEKKLQIWKYQNFSFFKIQSHEGGKAHHTFYVRPQMLDVNFHHYFVRPYLFFVRHCFHAFFKYLKHYFIQILSHVMLYILAINILSVFLKKNILWRYKCIKQFMEIFIS